MESSGWFKASRGELPMELIRTNPLAYILAAVIAHRARWRDGFNQHGLELGEAFLGDFENYGMTERNYRTAKEQLQKWKFATFKTTNRGTIGKLIDSRLFSTFQTTADGQNASQATDSRRTADGQPTTNKEHIKTEDQKEGEGTPPAITLSESERVTLDGQFKHGQRQLKQLGKPSDYAEGSRARAEIEFWRKELPMMAEKLGIPYFNPQETVDRNSRNHGQVEPPQNVAEAARAKGKIRGSA